MQRPPNVQNTHGAQHTVPYIQTRCGLDAHLLRHRSPPAPAHVLHLVIQILTY